MTLLLHAKIRRIQNGANRPLEKPTHLVVYQAWHINISVYIERSVDLPAPASPRAGSATPESPASCGSPDESAPSRSPVPGLDGTRSRSSRSGSIMNVKRFFRVHHAFTRVGSTGLRMHRSEEERLGEWAHRRGRSLVSDARFRLRARGRADCRKAA